MTRRIVLCIDDFGLTTGINTAAVALARAGRLGAISCMVGAPAWEEGARALRQLDGTSIDIGLHLDFTEAPLQANLRRPLGQLISMAYLRQLSRQSIRREIDAQIDAFEAGLGRPPDHVDGHQHVHQLPVVREALLAALRERGLHCWVRGTDRAPHERGFKPWLIQQLGGPRLRRLATRDHLPVSAHLLGVYDFTGGAGRYADRLSAWLARAQDADVLMCHASSDPPGIVASDPISQARWAEYQVLVGEPLPALLRRHGCEIAPLPRVRRPAPAA